MLKRRNKNGARNVLVNEDLTSTRATLAFQTRQLKKAGTISDCWTAAGKVMVKDNSGNVIHISNECDLAVYGRK